MTKYDHEEKYLAKMSKTTDNSKAILKCLMKVQMLFHRQRERKGEKNY